MRFGLSRLTSILFVLLILISFAACADQPSETVPTSLVTTTSEATTEPTSSGPVVTTLPMDERLAAISYDNYPIVDGSTATIPLAIGLIKAVTGCSDTQAEESILFNKTDPSYYALAEGRSDLLLAYAPAQSTVDELDVFNSMDVREIGLDALVFIVNENNPVESLTADQIRGIYSGAITNWQQVGGEDIEIIPFQRPTLSGSQTLMLTLMMKGTAMLQPTTETISDSMADIIEDIAAYNNSANAIGYSVYYYAKNMYVQPGLKFIAVEGIAPSNETINSRDYGFVSPFYGVIPLKPDTAAETLLDYLLTREGQQLLQDCGYVPVAQQTAQPTVTPIPPLVSVYKPRETLPDGRLFTEGLFAVLKGEGAAYQVYDSYGHFAYSFDFIQTDGDVNRPVGLYNGDELWELGYRDTSIFKDPGIQAYGSGFFRISYQGNESTVDLFNRNGQHILTLKNQCSPYEVTVSPYRSGTAVCFAPFGQKTTLYLISETGKIRKTIQTDTNSFALLGEKYLCDISDENEALVNLNGEVIREKIIPIEDQNLYMRGQEMSSFVLVGNYFGEGQTIFDARTLQPVAEDTIDPDIGLIRGLTYNVEGIPCQAYQNDNRGELIAVGYAGDRTAIRTQNAAYLFAAGGDRFYAMNQTMLILADSQSQNFRILSLATGQEVARIKGFHQMRLADEYIIVEMGNVQNGIPVGFYIIDQEGDIRYISEKSQASESRGDTITLQRGPYVGIADLNGDWLIKALDWETMRDANFYME